MSILSSLTSKAIERLSHGKHSLRIDNIIFGKTIYTMKDCEAVFADMNFCLVLLENAYGFSYFQSEIDYSHGRFVNKDIPAVMDDAPTYMKVAFTDALYCLLKPKTHSALFTGGLRDKARQRAIKLLEHIPSGSNILLLGAAAEIIEEAVRKKCSIKILDLEPEKIGLNFFSNHIENAATHDLEEAVQEAEYVIATGMVFVSESADALFKIVKNHGKSLSLYMESGSCFGSYLVEYGADVVLSEYFPYYDFYGDTRYDLYKKF